MHHIIIGAGPAGVVAAETLRKLDPDCTITLIGDEPEPPYSRMAIPYLLMENIEENGTYLRQKDNYAEQNIELLQDRVTSIDPAKQQLTLQSGQQKNYDRLLICTGSKPLSPPIEGIDLEGVHTCWTLEDARWIIKRADPGKKVLLMGAGFIGSIILEALAERKVDLTVVEMGDRMVPRMMNGTAGNMIKRWCEDKGVTIYTSTKLEKIALAQAQAQTQKPTTQPSIMQKLRAMLGGGTAKPSDTSAQADSAKPEHRFQVQLSNGETVPADLVITAAGVKPNIEFLEGSGIETDTGILVNTELQTSIPQIYAAGDVAQGRDFSTGEYAVHAIQPTAAEHGRIAAQNMLGQNTHYEGSLNMNVLDTLGLISSSFGLWMGVEGGEQAELDDQDNFRYLNLQFQDDILVGATCLGLTQHVGVLRGLIQGKVPLGAWKDKLINDPSRIMEAYLAKNYTAQHAA